MTLCLFPSFTSSVRVSASTRAPSLTSFLIWRTWASTARHITILLISVSRSTLLWSMWAMFLRLQACVLHPQSLRWRQGSTEIWIQCCLMQCRVVCAPRRGRKIPGTKVTLLVLLSITAWVIHHTFTSDTSLVLGGCVFFVEVGAGSGHKDLEVRTSSN